MGWVGVTKVVLDKSHPLREKGKYHVEEVWHLFRPRFVGANIVTELSLGCFTSEVAALKRLGEING